MDRLKTNLSDNALRFEKIKAIYSEAAGALDRAGVEHIVIKGFTQAPDYVANPRLRSQADFDLYCPPETIERARAALHGIGYVSEQNTRITNSDHGQPLVRFGDWQWRGNRFDPEMPPAIELHFCLWNERTSRLSVPQVKEFWERRTERKIGDLKFPCLSPIDHLGFLTLHILRNLFLHEWI